VILNVNIQLITQQTILTNKDNHYHSQKNYKFVSSKRHHRLLISILWRCLIRQGAACSTHWNIPRGTNKDFNNICYNILRNCRLSDHDNL